MKVPQPLAIHLLEVTLYAVHIPPQNPHISCPTNVKCLVRCSNLIKIYMHILTEHAISLSRFPAFLRPRGETRETFHPLVLPIHTADHSPPQTSVHRAEIVPVPTEPQFATLSSITSTTSSSSSSQDFAQLRQSYRQKSLNLEINLHRNEQRRVCRSRLLLWYC